MGASRDVHGSVVNLDPAGVLHALSQLAAAPDPPAPAFVTLLSSFRFDPRGHTTDQPARTRRASDASGYSCQQCNNTYSSKSNLKRHVNAKHTSRRKLVVTEVFDCEDCDDSFSTQAALDAHQADHPSSSTDAKSQKDKCVFCDCERANIYLHYGGHHKIEYPEQIMIESGNVLVRSDINTDGGKAAWFLREKEKMKSYKNVTCRLCEVETSFGNPEILTDHYVMYHQVDPTMLENLTHLFRAEKGAHLMDLPTSQASKRKQPDNSAVKEKITRLEDKAKVPINKIDLKVHLEKIELSGFVCKECDKAFASEARLNEHKTAKHTPKKEEDKTEKYTCALCFKSIVQIYKHYGNVHNVEYPEQMLFHSGKVLVRTTINTNDGQARWFVSEKEKAERKYTPNTCRLCEIVYENAMLLEKHYISQHKVEPVALERLDNLQCLFRAEKGAHLADLPASRRPPAKRQRRVSSKTIVKTNSERSSKVDIEEDGAGLIMYQCAECAVAATTCDASIEHAQLHQLPGYKPIPQTCDICNFAFEVQCFSDHAAHHLSRSEYRIVKFHPAKLLHAWSDMFQGLSESHVQRIKASSTYQYTRRVKMNADNAPGIPMYRCGKCEMYVRARDVEGHCYSKTACVEHQSDGHSCSDCDIYFCTSVGLTEHEKYHREYGTGCFRKVTFNCAEDEFINRALQKLQSARDEDPTPQKAAPQIKILTDVAVPLRFCGECKKSIPNSEYAAHAATHNYKQVANESVPGPQEQDCINSNKRNNSESHQINVDNNENNVEGTVEQWNSDNDSCRSLCVSSYTVQVEVHAPNVVDSPNDGTDTQDSACSQDNIALIQEFDSQIPDDLKRDMQSLGFVELGMDKNHWAYIPDDLATDNVLEAIDAALGYSSLSTVNDNKIDISTSLDTTSTVVRVGSCNNTRDVNANMTEIEAVAQKEQDCRPSSRDILTRMIEDEWDEALEERV